MNNNQNKILNKILKNYVVRNEEHNFETMEIFDNTYLNKKDLVELKKCLVNKKAASQEPSLIKIFDKFKIGFLNELESNVDCELESAESAEDDANCQKLYEKAYKEATSKLSPETIEILGIGRY